MQEARTDPFAHELIASLHIEYPMLFELSAEANPEQHTHAGVLEFISEEGRVYLPHWVIGQHLVLHLENLV